MINAIAAIGTNRELGKDNKLLWDIPEDMKRFREVTAGHPVIMGRKTWDSIGKALPGRTNIVISRNSHFLPTGAIAVQTIDAAIAQAQAAAGAAEIFVIGGAEIYTMALPRIERLYLTIVEGTFDADAFFPDYSAFTNVVQKGEQIQSGSFSFHYETLEK
ncbi:dihydrofolate reductase [Candidatus Microgenomates bacterium]|nr:dihydrofolate reductase [Candidatus Microgenomates bacterium]